MNIKEAKQEIKHTLQAYLKKDEFGGYVIPQVRQRPVLLIGAPGIGKTAIMEQIAQEEGLALLSYTMTHHTRQSAVGLPFIVKKEYGGREHSVTEYTMSEIIAAVYEKIEETGIKEGILFLDEINCVSETLAPTMLQFLQAKTFGNQRLPEGFLIVAAGNPPEYNKSVREFDIVTLDRVKYISVTEDFSVWKEYAYAAKIAPVILSYLELKKENFYRMEGLLGEKQFVTARGWQDLSELMTCYEELSIPVTEDVIRQYVQHDEIARDFFLYYELYQRYRSLYRIKEILLGASSEELQEKLKDCGFDEKISILSLLLEGLNESFHITFEQLKVQRALVPLLKRVLTECETSGMSVAAEIGKEYREECRKKESAGLLSKDETMICRKTAKRLEELCRAACEQADAADKSFAGALREAFAEAEDRRIQDAREANVRLDRAFAFLETVWGRGQELVVFLTELSMNPYSSSFLLEYGNERYAAYSRELLLTAPGEDIEQKIRQAKEMKFL
ncbi:MAG: ATP-binding protein [Lachnospiraceae bacterium]